MASRASVRRSLAVVEIVPLVPAQVMTVVLVEYRNITRANLEDIPLHVFDFAFPGNAIACLQMIAIAQQ